MNQKNYYNNGALFALLRVGLFPDLWLRSLRSTSYAKAKEHGGRDMANDSSFDGVDWENVYQLAQEQSVLGLALAGIERYKNLNANLNLNISKVLLLQWIGEVQVIEKQNKDMNAFIAELIEKLRKEDIYAILVKGQGIAQCYEKPLWRSSGDVDLLLSKDNYEKAKAFLHPLGDITEPEEANKKHFAMQIEQWTVELHGTLHVGLSARADRMLDNVQYDVFHRGEVRSVALDVNDSLNDNGTTKSFKSVQVFLPAENEDVVYVFAHILQHFYKGGIGLRQICDWCRLLYTYRDSLNYGLLEQRIKRTGLMSEWKAFYNLASRYLGMPDFGSGLTIHDSRFDKKADRIMEFVLKSGNMGHNRDMSHFSKYPYLIRKCISMCRRIGDLINHARIFPLDSLRFFPRIMFNGLRSAMRGE